MACYKNVVIADAPISYWRLGESSGTTAADEMGANAGTYVNGPTLGVAGALGDGNTAITCAPSSQQYVNVAGLTVVPAAWSLECWFKTTALVNDNGIIGWSGVGTPDAGLSFNNFLRIKLHVGATDMNFDPIGSFIDGVWHHLVGTYDGTSGRVYLDGVLGAGPTTLAFTAGTNSTTFKLGQYGNPSGSNYDGSLDEGAFYNFALSDAQVAAHYAAAPNLCATPRSYAVMIA